MGLWKCNVKKQRRGDFWRLGVRVDNAQYGTARSRWGADVGCALITRNTGRDGRGRGAEVGCALITRNTGTGRSWRGG